MPPSSTSGRGDPAAPAPAAPPGPAEKKGDGAADEDCQVQNVAPTGVIFGATLERLNRQATVTLLGSVIAEVDEHCKALRRRWLAFVLVSLLALILGVVCLILALLLRQRATTVVCPPPPQVVCCTSSSAAPATHAADGASGQSGQRDGAPGQPLAASQTPDLPTLETELERFLAEPGGKVPRMFTLERLHYPENSHEMNSEGKEQVFLLGRILAAHPTAKIEIRGHLDGTEREVYTGPKPYRDYSLSLLRADCVYQRLLGQNIAASRLKIRGLGASQHLTDDATEEHRQQNRRVEIIVTKR